MDCPAYTLGQLQVPRDVGTPQAAAPRDVGASQDGAAGAPPPTPPVSGMSCLLSSQVIQPGQNFYANPNIYMTENISQQNQQSMEADTKSPEECRLPQSLPCNQPQVSHLPFTGFSSFPSMTSPQNQTFVIPFNMGSFPIQANQTYNLPVNLPMSSLMAQAEPGKVHTVSGHNYQISMHPSNSGQPNLIMTQHPRSAAPVLSGYEHIWRQADVPQVWGTENYQVPTVESSPIIIGSVDGKSQIILEQSQMQPNSQQQNLSNNTAVAPNNHVARSYTPKPVRIPTSKTTDTKKYAASKVRGIGTPKVVNLAPAVCSAPQKLHQYSQTQFTSRSDTVCKTTNSSYQPDNTLNIVAQNQAEATSKNVMVPLRGYEITIVTPNQSNSSEQSLTENPASASCAGDAGQQVQPSNNVSMGTTVPIKNSILSQYLNLVPAPFTSRVLNSNQSTQSSTDNPAITVRASDVGQFISDGPRANAALPLKNSNHFVINVAPGSATVRVLNQNSKIPAKNVVVTSRASDVGQLIVSPGFDMSTFPFHSPISVIQQQLKNKVMVPKKMVSSTPTPSAGDLNPNQESSPEPIENPVNTLCANDVRQDDSPISDSDSVLPLKNSQPDQDLSKVPASSTLKVACDDRKLQTDESLKSLPYDTEKTKSNVLKHVVDGYVIKEAAEPFPVSDHIDPPDHIKQNQITVSSLSTITKPNQVTEGELVDDNKNNTDKECTTARELADVFMCEQCGNTSMVLKKQLAVAADHSPSVTSSLEAVNDAESVTSVTLEHRASSPVGLQPDCPALKWGVNEVADFIRGIPHCEMYAEDFINHEVDGMALLLIQTEHLTGTLSILLGPALKIVSWIDTLRTGTTPAWHPSNKQALTTRLPQKRAPSPPLASLFKKPKAL